MKINTRKGGIAALFAFCFLVLALLPGCGAQKNAQWNIPQNMAAIATEAKGYGNVAYDILRNTQKRYDKRIAGKEKEKDFGAYIYGQILAADYGKENVEIQDFHYMKGIIPKEGNNIIVTKKGRSDKTIVVGAHYDSVSTHGVDDNGSGVAVLLETMSRVRTMDLPYTVEFVFFCGEEIGFVGSKRYVKELDDSKKEKIAYMVNLDSLLAGDKCYIYGGFADFNGNITKTEAVDGAKALADRMGLAVSLNPGKNKDYPTPTTGDWSDHVPFRDAEIPYLYLEATNWDLKPYDGTTQTETLGKVMHTDNDNLDILEEKLGSHPKENLATFVSLLEGILVNGDTFGL